MAKKKRSGNSLNDVWYELIRHLESHKKMLNMITLLANKMNRLEKKIEKRT